MRVVVLLLLMMTTSVYAETGDIKLLIMPLSYHYIHRPDGWNETNAGLGVQYKEWGMVNFQNSNFGIPGRGENADGSKYKRSNLIFYKPDDSIFIYGIANNYGINQKKYRVLLGAVWKWNIFTITVTPTVAITGLDIPVN